MTRDDWYNPPCDEGEDMHDVPRVRKKVDDDGWDECTEPGNYDLFDEPPGGWPE